jgi:hypothetical protein
MVFVWNVWYDILRFCVCVFFLYFCVHFVRMSVCDEGLHKDQGVHIALLRIRTMIGILLSQLHPHMQVLT